jgi:hypothetical protein
MLYSYSYKPDPEFQSRGSETNQHTFGVEIEIDDGHDRNQLIYELDQLNLPIYQKLDGSLHCNGVEIISHPGSLAWHRYAMRWAEVFRLCRKYDYDSDRTSTCGLHIHVGRKTLGRNTAARRETAAKLVLLVNALWDEGLVTFTRRRGAELSNWAPRPRVAPDIMRNWSPENIVRYALDAGGQDGPHNARYKAVNLTNDSTVEFRIFKGTLKRERLIASIQLVDTLIHYAMKHSVADCLELDWRGMMEFDSYGIAYKELAKQSAALGLYGEAAA